MDTVEVPVVVSRNPFKCEPARISTNTVESVEQQFIGQNNREVCQVNFKKNDSPSRDGEYAGPGGARFLCVAMVASEARRKLGLMGTPQGSAPRQLTD